MQVRNSSHYPYEQLAGSNQVLQLYVVHNYYLLLLIIQRHSHNYFYLILLPQFGWFVFVFIIIVAFLVIGPKVFPFVLYLIGSVATLLFLLYLALSRYGDIRLGDTAPDFSTFSWSAMLFCGGIGTSILYWGTVEWAHYYESPPFSVVPGTPEALNWAVSYPIFHWGLIGWALYCLPGVAVSYSYYVRGAKSLRLSEACEPIIGRQANGLLGRIIDLLFVVGLVGACSTGIGSVSYTHLTLPTNREV